MTLPIKFRKRSALLGALVAALSSIAIMGSESPSAAWNPLGCQYADRNITFYVHENDAPTTDFLDAAQRWEAGTVITLNKVLDPANRDIRVRNHDFGATGWTGLTHKDGDLGSGARCNANGYWVNKDVAIAVNTNYNVSYPLRRRGVAIHEFGHALGLAHNSTVVGHCPEGGQIYQAIMFPNDDRFTGGCPVLVPQSDDNIGVNTLY